jgi:hypothetical protein
MTRGRIVSRPSQPSHEVSRELRLGCRADAVRKIVCLSTGLCLSRFLKFRTSAGAMARSASGLGCVTQPGSISDSETRSDEVRSTPTNRHCQLDRQCPKSANSGNIGVLRGVVVSRPLLVSRWPWAAQLQTSLWPVPNPLLPSNCTGRQPFATGRQVAPQIICPDACGFAETLLLHCAKQTASPAMRTQAVDGDFKPADSTRRLFL